MKFLLLALLPAVAFCQLGGGMAGGWSDTTVNKNDEEVAFAINAATAKVAEMDAHLTAEQLSPEIFYAQTQVVQGENLRLTIHMAGNYICNVTVWYRSWMHGDQKIQVTDGPLCTKMHGNRRAMVGAMVGGVSGAKALPDGGIDSTGNDVMAALKFASCAFNSRSNNMFASQLGDLSGISYTSQLTAGMTYRFHNVPMQTTECRTGSECGEVAACNALASAMTTTCDFSVQVQPWMTPSMTLNDMNCQ